MALAAATAYVEVYQGTPVLLQLYVIYYGLAEVVRLDAMSAAVLGLGMNYAAYEAHEVYMRLQAVPPGQMEAALSLGMSTPLALRQVVSAGAARRAAAMTNDFIALLEGTARWCR
ncbi:MAG: ABC transporter permease subunit [Polyangiales bacterium]